MSVEEKRRAEFCRAVTEHHSRNFLLNVGDSVGFRIGHTFIAPLTILNVFASTLTDSQVLVGLVPALFIFCWCFPQILVAYHSDGLYRKKGFILLLRALQPLPFLVLGLLLWLGAVSAPSTILALLFVCIVLFAVMGGAFMPPWVALIGKIIRKDLRGRFYAWRSVAGTLVGFGIGFLIRDILGGDGGPERFGILFICSAAGFLVSIIALAGMREPADLRAAEREGLGSFIKELPGILRTNKVYRLFLVVGILMCFGGGAVGMAAPFYSVYAFKVLKAPVSILGVFTAIILPMELLGALAGGFLCDRKGPFLTYTFSVVAALLAAVCALCARTVGGVGVTIALLGLSAGAMATSYHNVLLILAPAEKRGTFLGLTNFARSPFMLLGPVLGGLVIDRWGFSATFACAVAGSGLALAFSVWMTARGRPIALKTLKGDRQDGNVRTEHLK